ncbi:MAG: CRISPR-associated protein Csc3 [Cyanobacteria bacterium P01_F01_bin.150]
MRLLNRPPKTIEERYFSDIRPLLYERHGAHAQSGIRKKHTLAEHLDSACQFVLTVSKMAMVPDDKRAVILAATAVHDLNKIDKAGRNVKKLARDKGFLREELEKAGVISFITGEDDLELARRLIERHSGHNASDGALFLPEDTLIQQWTAILIAADLFDLDLPAEDLKKKLQKELTVALDRPSNLYRIRVSEDRGYMTALLLGACEDVLLEYNLTPLAIFPDGELFEGKVFPDIDLVPQIAARWQSKIDSVFGNNVEQLVTPESNGIRIMNQAVQQDLQEVVRAFLYQIEKKKNDKYDRAKLQADINKHILKKSTSKDIEVASSVGLSIADSANEFALSEALKGVFISYGQIKPKISANQRWEKIANHVGLSKEQCQALELFDPQYARSLLAAKAIKKGIEGVQNALMESLKMRRDKSDKKTKGNDISKDLINLVYRTLNLPFFSQFSGFYELDAYIQAKPKQRCSLGPTISHIKDLAAMPVGTKVQVFSNRLPGGLSDEPKRKAEATTLLAYQLLAIGAHFPKVKKKPPHYLHLALPKGSCPELLRIWRECLLGFAATNAEGGPVFVDVVKLYKDNAVEFTSNKVVGFAFPKRPEFVHNTVQLPMTWGETNNSVALLKSLRLALELSLSLDFEFPFVLSSSLQIEPSIEHYGRVEGIPSSFSKLLGTGCYSRHEAETVRDRLRCLGNLVQAVSSVSKFDDCLYDLARATTQPFSLYYVLLRWILREKSEISLESSWLKIRDPLKNILESLMPNENKKLTLYLKEAAQLAAEVNLKGSSFNRTSITKPFTDFLKDVRASKSYVDLDFLFAALSQKFHNHLDRILEYKVGGPKLNQIVQYYNILRNLYEEVYDARPEKLLNDRENLTAAYLFFWQEAYQVVKAKKDAEAKRKGNVDE